MPDERTYGFNRDDAGALLQSISNGEDWYPEIKPRGGGGGAKRIRFTVEEVVCPGPYVEELHVLVRWTYYTGGCGQEPPGINYEGLIEVYDDCVLSYFTAEDLVDRTGSATYWYSRAEEGSPCEAEWIVDHICGEPQC